MKALAVGTIKDGKRDIATFHTLLRSCIVTYNFWTHPEVLIGWAGQKPESMSGTMYTAVMKVDRELMDPNHPWNHPDFPRESDLLFPDMNTQEWWDEEIHSLPDPAWTAMWNFIWRDKR